MSGSAYSPLPRSLGTVLRALLAVFWCLYVLVAPSRYSEGAPSSVGLSDRSTESAQSPAFGLMREAKTISTIIKNANELGLILPPHLQPESTPPAAGKKQTNQPAEGEGSLPALEKSTSRIKSQEMAVETKRDTKSEGKVTVEKRSDELGLLTYDACQAKYGTARYLEPHEARRPPMLYTFPGSGNTWARLLIDKASGIYSGSVYNDRKLVPALPGELKCDWSVSVVKTHPHTHPGISLLNGGFHSDGDMKCNRGNVKFFTKAVLLIRDPYDSIWSEFQRRASDSHVAGIKRSEFDMVHWLANACNLAHRYLEMWRDHYSVLEERLPAADILYVKYEDLVDKEKRVDALQSVMKFIGFDQVSEERIRCAFRLANSKHAKRSVSDDMITKKELYTHDLACKMWATFGMHAVKHGYTPWKNYNCSGYDEILADMNVGPSGTLNKQWMAKRGINIDEMNRGIAPVGSLSVMNKPIRKANSEIVSRIAANGRLRGGSDSAVLDPGRVAVATLQSAAKSSNRNAGSLTGLGSLGKDKPAWSD